MTMTIKFSTGKEIELTEQEITELFKSKDEKSPSLQPYIPIYPFTPNTSPFYPYCPTVTWTCSGT